MNEKMKQHKEIMKYYGESGTFISSVMSVVNVILFKWFELQGGLVKESLFASTLFFLGALLSSFAIREALVERFLLSSSDLKKIYSGGFFITMCRLAYPLFITLGFLGIAQALYLEANYFYFAVWTYYFMAGFVLIFIGLLIVSWIKN